MITQKFKYIVKRPNGHTFLRYFSLGEIEIGDALQWLKVNNIDERNLCRCQFINYCDIKGNEVYENDKVKCEAVDAQGNCHEMIGVIEWDSEECCFAVMTYGDKWPVIMFRFITMLEIMNES